MSLAQSWDVIIIGGGAAGTAAAVGAANAGAKTLLVESTPFLGGAATLKNVLTYCGLFTNNQKKQTVLGVADQMLQRLREMGAVSEPIQFHGVAVLIEPESVKYVLDQLCKKAGVQVWNPNPLDNLHNFVDGCIHNINGIAGAIGYIYLRCSRYYGQSEEDA